MQSDNNDLLFAQPLELVIICFTSSSIPMSNKQFTNSYQNGLSSVPELTLPFAPFCSFASYHFLQGTWPILSLYSCCMNEEFVNSSCLIDVNANNLIFLICNYQILFSKKNLKTCSFVCLFYWPRKRWFRVLGDYLIQVCTWSRWAKITNEPKHRRFGLDCLPAATHSSLFVMDVLLRIDYRCLAVYTVMTDA